VERINLDTWISLQTLTLTKDILSSPYKIDIKDKIVSKI